MKKKFKVTLPIDIDGTLHLHGSIVELDEETAKLYNHALIAVVEDEKEHAGGGNS